VIVVIEAVVMMMKRRLTVDLQPPYILLEPSYNRALGSVMALFTQQRGSGMKECSDANLGVEYGTSIAARSLYAQACGGGSCAG
jgi:hypothetical protein